ncbi:MAG: type 1 glutamine amidotransferase [Ethanoligenens sp.]
MHLHYLQHIPLETPGSILSWAEERGYLLSHTAFFNGEDLPSQQDFDWLIVMGGPMNIYEEQEHPWIALEKAFIRQAINTGKTVIGICLGSQLIADVIGGKVTRGALPEIGWTPVTWNETAKANPLFAGFPETSVVFEWHYDTFSTLPEEAVVLASSPACAHQAFVYRERVFGFQFHLENTPDMLRGYIAASGDEMVPGPYTQTPEQVMAHPARIAENNAWMAAFLTALENRQTQ